MGDYHRARWRELAKLTDPENCYAADLGTGDSLYKWANTEENNQYFRLSEKPVEQVGAFEALNSFKKIIKDNDITYVCIPGYGRAAYILMLLWCRLKGIKVLMFAESWYPGNLILDKLKGIFIKQTTDICFVSGKRAKEHFIKRLNYSENKIIEGYSTVDNDHFSSGKAEKATPPQLLCVARFAPEKNLELLIKAFKSSKLSEKWELRIVGGGPLKNKLQEMSEGANINLTDWLSYEQLPDLYSSASCFILPSIFEPWGLVVNEAMAAGLPVILSDRVGAYPDLLKKNENGWLFDAENKDELTGIFDSLLEMSEKELKEMGMKSKNIIAGFTPKIWAQKVLDFMKNNNHSDK